jgi:hypothetical protein
MGLCLCVFDGEEEVDGVEAGSYEDFGALRDYVAGTLEGGTRGSRYPIFMLHSDCDGVWPAEACRALAAELADMKQRMMCAPALQVSAEPYRSIAARLELRPSSGFESFIDVDGCPVLERLIGLFYVAVDRELPILFQ